MQKILGLTYTATVFLSAFLLFMVQPMVSKAILPTLGGGPSIWNTSMLFFQVLLLGGYFYAYLLARIKSSKIQLFVHLAFLVGAATFLPFATHIAPPDNISSPILYQIAMMTGMVSLPFFILSSTAPLLQKWFSHTNHDNASSPYFLYAASNIGSILGLLLYPLVVEQFLDLSSQSFIWTTGFGILTALLALCGFISKFHRHSSDEIAADNDTSPSPTWGRMAQWVFLAFVPSSLFLGYTTYVTTEIGSLPLIWVIPLALYILSIIIAFGKNSFLSLPLTRILFVFLFPFVFGVLPLAGIMDWRAAIFQCTFLFFACTLCHQEMVQLKPTAKHLTVFYLMMSLGGALGGVFNAILAPLIFVEPHEYMIAIFFTVLCWNITAKLDWTYPLKSKSFLIFMVIAVLAICAFYLRSNDALRYYGFFIVPLFLILTPMLATTRTLFIAACLLINLSTPIIPWETGNDTILSSRNYFGHISVLNDDEYRTIVNGATIHGAQALDSKYKHIPLTYYNEETPNGLAIKFAREKSSSLNIAVLGLGAGTMAALLHKGDQITFYEINPDIISVATDQNLFTYLTDTAATTKIIEGDARLKLANAPDNSYDVLIIDVFSSDSIPMHLITRESTELYKRKIKPTGMIVFHVSSRYYELRPEVARLGKAINLRAFTSTSSVKKIADTPLSFSATRSSILTNNPYYIEQMIEGGWTETTSDNKSPWTDDFANPLRAIAFHW